MQNQPVFDSLLKGEHHAAMEITIEQLRPWLASVPPDRLFRVNVGELSAETNVPFEQLRDFFLYAVADGVFKLSWEFHCPHCNAIPDFHHTFSESKAHGHCPLCNVDFRNILDENVEVTFTVHPAVMPLSTGLEDELKTRMIAEARAGTWKMPAQFLSGMDCLHSRVFRSLFGGDVLSSEESLSIERGTLLFTDIRGSTKMYSDLGDPPSYNVVRRHFKIIFREIESEGGIVVKTIGDAVMASFRAPAEALAAALRIYQDFRRERLDPAGFLEIRTGIHVGPVIVVTLNDRLDYFGNTVNTAARIQGKIEGHSVGFSKPVFENEECRSVLRRFLDEQAAVGDPLDIIHRHTELKGIEGLVDVYFLRERV